MAGGSLQLVGTVSARFGIPGTASYLPLFGTPRHTSTRLHLVRTERASRLRATAAPPKSGACKQVESCGCSKATLQHCEASTTPRIAKTCLTPAAMARLASGALTTT